MVRRARDVFRNETGIKTASVDVSVAVNDVVNLKVYPVGTPMTGGSIIFAWTLDFAPAP
ncbi:MAG: hypothetical protein ACQXXH_08290 [Candidatus Bathyarchaeia archaeon]|nr:hypothetical protein [Candidatus Bathyarchaeota archaeon A05DMB-4]MDH7596003.1 hypothetical protein [Candidatus Bathyarchaeota archaeon]